MAIAFVVYFAQAWINTLLWGHPLETDGARPGEPAGRYAFGVTPRRLRVDDFEYGLPPDAIAQTPAEPRDASRLLVLDRRVPGGLDHARFGDIGRWLRAGDLLVVNDSRVIPARLRATRAGGGAAEVLVLRPMEGETERWEALVRPSRRLAEGAVWPSRGGQRLEVGERLGDGTRAIRFDGDPHAVMAAAGEMPLPPYIHDRSTPADRYQTVYARPRAQPPPRPPASTSPRAARRAGGERRAPGHGDAARWSRHVPAPRGRVRRRAPHPSGVVRDPRGDAAVRARGRAVVAVGTTAVRVLETAARTDAATGWSDLYITPPHEFGAVDALITNFHLPRSSLLLLVTAFVQAGMDAASPFEARDRLLEAYRAALSEGYRFFSFGDAMLIR